MVVLYFFSESQIMVELFCLEVLKYVHTNTNLIDLTVLYFGTF